MKRTILTFLHKMDLTALNEGYLGSIPVKLRDWQLAKIVAHGRNVANEMGRSRVKIVNPEVQYWNDLKGGIAEIVLNGFIIDLQRAKKLVGVADCAPLLEILPAKRADTIITKNDKDYSFDIKGSSALVDGLFNRDDKLVTINIAALETYRKAGLSGIFAVKVYGTVADVCFYSLDSVEKWKRNKGAQSWGDYYSIIMPVFDESFPEFEREEETEQ